MDRKLRLGLMGCGVVADYGHLHAISANPDIELVALYDPNPEAVARVQSAHGNPPGFTDEAEFWGVGMDAVSVCSPAPAHILNVRAAAHHRVHVLCEKPLASDDDEGEEMIRLMAAADRMLFVGFVYRFSIVSRQIKQWIAEGVIGEVRSLRLYYVWNLHGRYEPLATGKWEENPRWRGRMLEGGPIVDCGVHMIDLTRWWTGRDVRAFTEAGAWVADYEAPDHMWLHLDMEGGAHSAIEMSFSYGHTARDAAPLFTYDVIGTGGVIRYDRTGWLLEVRNGEGNRRGTGGSEKNFAGMYEEFVRAWRTGTVGDMPTAADGLIATRIARDATDNLIRNRIRSLPEDGDEFAGIPKGRATFRSASGGDTK